MEFQGVERFMRQGLALAVFSAVLAVGVPLYAAAGQVVVNPDTNATVQLPSDPQGAMRAARERVAAGDIAGAVKSLATYVAAHPTENDPQRLLGDLYYRQGDLAHAEAAYKAILARAPTDRETHNRLGSVYATENRVDDAIAEFNSSLPGTDSVTDLVRLHLLKGDLDEYQHLMERAARNYPTDANVISELAEVYSAIHRPDLAIVYFKKALDGSPDLLVALNGIGVSFMDERDYASAIQYLSRCHDRNPRDYSCADNLGAAYLESGKLDLAQSTLDAAHSLEPERSEAIVNFGYLADARGDWKRGVGFYLQALGVYPYSVDAYIDLGYDYEQHQLYSLAASALIKGLTVSPKDGRLHFILGQVYVDEHQFDLADAQFKLAAASDDPVAKQLAQQRLAATIKSPTR